MIKLKINTHEIQVLTRFLQMCINQLLDSHSHREKCIAPVDTTGLINKENNAVKNIIRIAERSAHIEEFEKLQYRLISRSSRHDPDKKKTINHPQT